MVAEDDSQTPTPAPLPIDGVLDLHTFKPEDIGELLPDYFAACREKGILEVRVIHGKGTGALRRGVLALLPRLPEVETFAESSQLYGGWGATMVKLKPLETEKTGSP
jgi:DNA-nicking Smr family endonuclease